ncbi:hypothetical protein ACH4PU_09755 [Streptomyces sp. NPDC021100]|uniref:hypothetical protein n=1 Tax=Streptomyces sp. NPDC021100 TaxID=3365114 RepID=UPI0037B9D933
MVGGVVLGVLAGFGGVGQAAAGGGRGPVVTHPGSVPFAYAAGDVCSFPARAEFPVSDLTVKTWNDAEGNPRYAVESGALALRATSLRTGKSVDRDVSGTAVMRYAPGRPGTFVMSGYGWATGFQGGDRPAHRWIVARDHMSVLFGDENGRNTKRLLALSGRYEDLCRTLA